jgi:hypothetical protein
MYYFYVHIDHTIEVEGALQKSRYSARNWSQPAAACCSANEKKYGKGCNSKFYAFSGFMNPRLSALLLPARRSIPAHPE